MYKTVAIVAAAGQGKRMGSALNKQYLSLEDKPVLAHTLGILHQHPLIEGIIVVVKEDEIELCFSQVVNPYKISKVLKVIPGGKERQDSIYAGLKALPSECQLVVVHDGARPFIAPNIISETINAGMQKGAAIAAVPVKDTIKRVSSDNKVIETIPRSELWAVQTPQVFSKDLIKQAYENGIKAGFIGTDDASFVELLGHQVEVILGSYENIKITTPEDIGLGISILSKRSSMSRS
ncbi:MAG: 2-C-methyl-D-erythritol 4-phosphate cytidylyltransferase [Bacillota bacterium]